MNQQLPDYVYAQVTNLCGQGNELMQMADFVSARGKYIEALQLLPENHKIWEAATWIYVAIGDTHFHERNFEKSFRCFFNAIQCPKGLGNPYIHLRLGQSYFEMGDLEKAADELVRAYMGGGMEIFMEDDPKYLEYLETKIDV
ncbi:hypothetical protein [Parachitinimonas caeni]|uniref:Tetratricopeptide repeat protein n=1 Tax=Parachitinimonas caeni TaxID=3031301 RepID=A0ABT7E3X2_9NEIS|nr:hypothetical protein [Parachitinimonas caeni]MDK2127003.1 hypothetical protein [Parachitinimonas caeni]